MTDNQRRRSVGQRLKDDLAKTNGPKEIVTTLWRRPIILVKGIVVGLVSLAVIAGGLAVFGAFDQLGEWAWLALFGAAGWIGSEIYEEKTPGKRD